MSLSKEESNFLRFYFLNLKIASKAVRVYFDSVHPPPGLVNELANSSRTLKGLRFITNSQLKILYPSPACNVRSEHFDSTLIVCLLRNMTPCESAPVTGWDNLPHPCDTSTGADLARVKWYRNMLAHHGDGKLSLTDFSQYWADIEGAILRLGGPSLLKDSQSAQHIVIDTSLTDILNTLRLCEKDVCHLQMSQEKHANIINDLQTTCDNQRSVKEKHENKIQQLENSVQKGETEAQNLAIKLSYTNRSIAKSKEEIEACKKEIEENEEKIKVLQEQSMDKKNQIDELITQVDKLEIKYEQHDKMLKEHGEHLAKHDGEIAKQDEQIAKHDEQMSKHDGQMAKHDEQIATNAKDIDDIKKTQHDTDDSSNESKRKRLEDDTKALTEEDLREGTFVTTKALKDGLLLLKLNGVLLMTGHAGTGKSRISRHILHMFCTEYTSYKCIKLNKLQEWEDMVRREDNVVVLLDDIFGETNCIYNREKDIPILDKVHAYVCKGNIKVIITIRDTVKRQCQEAFDSHRLFNHDIVDLSSDNFKFSEIEKKDIFTIYMKTVRQLDFYHNKGFVDHNGITILETNEISNITNENPVKGFPLVVYQFVHNDKYFQLGSKFFDRPTEVILDEINEIRHQGEIHQKFMIQYGVLVFIALNENSINPDDNSNVTEVAEIIDAIYGETIRMKKYHILDAVKELKGSYLVKIPNQRSYRYHHPTLQESVILSFAQIDDETMNKIIPLLNWTFFLKMVKPNAYKEKEGEVVLRIPSNTYQLLAYQLVDIYMAEFTTSADYFLNSLCNTEIFQQEDCVLHVLMTYLLDAVEKTDYKDNYTDNMIRSNDVKSRLSFVRKKDVFLAVLLKVLVKKEEKFETFQLILERFNQNIRTGNCFTIDYMKAALITSLYEKVKSVKYVKALLDIIEENKIPVLLDQNIKLSKLRLTNDSLFRCDYYDSYPAYVFLSLCIVNAYLQFNIPLLEYLLSRYHHTLFDINLFFKVCYSKYWIRRSSSQSHKSLKWMIEKFEDQELIDIDSILRFACKYEMLETLKYLASKCKTFDAISCLKIFLCLDYFEFYKRFDDINHLCDEDTFYFLVSKIDKSSTDLISLVILVLQYTDVPGFMLDIFIQHVQAFLNNEEILILVCKNAHFYAAKQIMEKSQKVDIQSAVLACTCITNQMDSEHKWKCHEQLRIMKYIFYRFGYEQFDLKALCQRAYHSKKFKIIEWLVQNIDLSLLNVDFIRNSILKKGGLDILQYTVNKTKLSSCERIKVLKSIIKYYTSACSTKILEIVSAVWNSTDDKQELKMEEIVIAAYQRNCFDILMWIYENCNSYVSTDVRKLFMLACADGRVKVATWVLQTFEPISLDINEGQLFILAFDKMLKGFDLENVERVNWVLKHFQIKPLDLKSGLLRLICMDNRKWDNLWRFRRYLETFPDLVVSIFEKCLYCLSKRDLEEVMNTCLYQKCYLLVNWFLKIDSLFSFDNQHILNKACADAAFETVKLMSKYFSSLDMNNAMINACISYDDYGSIYDTSDSIVACLDLLWKETDHASIEISRIVSTVCREEYVCDNVMTWILLNFQHNRIPINEVLIACCKQRKIYHVQYIFHKIDNEQLDTKEAFCSACRKTSQSYDSNNDVILVDFLFRRLHDKTSSLSIILNELLLENSYDLILYFLKKGYLMNIHMKHLMNQACRFGHRKLVQWILANVQHKKLDIKSAFHAACTHEYRYDQLQCVALIWHYVQDLNMLDIDNVLKAITEAQSNMTYSSDDSMNCKKYMTLQNGDLMNWIKCIKNINHRKICKSETSMLNTDENKT